VLVSIHQPHYLPWLRYFEKVALSEFFILLDDVDYTRNGWQNRNRIKSHSGPQLLTIPVSGALGASIREMKVSNAGWARKHWATLAQSYASAPFFDQYQQSLQRLYAMERSRLVDINEAMFSWHLEALDLKVPWTCSSSLQSSEKSTARLIELILEVGGTGYLTGEFAFAQYLDAGQFHKAGLDLWIFDWESPVYAQVHPKRGFVPELATLDLLFNAGGLGAREVLTGAGRVRRYRG
jgi:hypothetical protein